LSLRDKLEKPTQADSHVSRLRPKRTENLSDSSAGHRALAERISIPEIALETQKGTGIAASPHVTGLQPLIPKDTWPGFGGMLHSRRQGHASFASVTGAG